MLEKLYRLKWGRLDGLGALVISPTRELALQIFDELRKVGARHAFSAGLLIGGKDVRQERERVNGGDPAMQDTHAGDVQQLQPNPCANGCSLCCYSATACAELGTRRLTLTSAGGWHAGMNILVCTPGRLLQHMDETPGFDCMGLQALVLDEADRILDMVGATSTVK